MDRSRFHNSEINVKVYHRPVITRAEQTEANHKLLNKPNASEFIKNKPS